LSTPRSLPQAQAGEPAALKPEDLSYRVLLAVPQALTIPVLGLGVEAQRPPVEVSMTSSRNALSRVVGGNLSRALVGGRYGEHRLLMVRRRIQTRIALYASWLAFPESTQAEAFVSDHPRFGLSSIEARTRADHTRRSAGLKAHVAVGRYDLRLLKARDRLSRAKEYVRLSEELDRIAWGLNALRILRESLDTASADGTSVG
jgi:hypothetical protein